MGAFEAPESCSIYCLGVFENTAPEPYVMECTHCSRTVVSLLYMHATMLALLH